MATKKANPTDPDLAPQDVDAPPSTGPTVQTALEPATAPPADSDMPPAPPEPEPGPAPEPSVLPGHEGEVLATVTLSGSGPGDGVYRVAAPIPLVVASNGGRYVLSNRAAGAYIWQR